MCQQPERQTAKIFHTLCEINSLYCPEVTDHSGLGTDILGASNLMSRQRERINIAAFA